MCVCAPRAVRARRKGDSLRLRLSPQFALTYSGNVEEPRDL